MINKNLFYINMRIDGLPEKFLRKRTPGPRTEPDVLQFRRMPVGDEN